jgi:hypothetical protein
MQARLPVKDVREGCKGGTLQSGMHAHVGAGCLLFTKMVLTITNKVRWIDLCTRTGHAFLLLCNGSDS